LIAYIMPFLPVAYQKPFCNIGNSALI
jgi:hypothetical protein